ncbi:6-pyruvoyl trahydropterin synthase family protein [Paenibacillus radicis (ex Gao et al. 2016)]|uniref:6-carboxy-5,6,7,8-tetrahydropterin synthase n=1 Tax=Paenibacillus radicis (ex Gao et al. 2016) TaxID=1737354 RepID=A0A917HNF3_9BACL|nr:6-pyruvoyl tetrahydropterin synthase family protein [Paenibacillus radicis (ex Gao et al. 2016)]GGG84129.1 6-carboxy-5,6,7,8-tetrahydropterin synthase [Paenibacillus radicis (ex Gao et al. 2016)]
MMQQIYPQTPHPYQYELNKDLHFAAAHFIPTEEAGKCARVHGHTYFTNVTIAGDMLDSSGFLVNFSAIKKLIHDRFDHGILNDHADLFGVSRSENGNAGEADYPTTEVVARTICELVQAYLDKTANKPVCIQVYLRETPSSYVVYRPRRAAANG